MGKKRKVVNCDEEEFESIRAAARHLGVNMTSILASIERGTKTKNKRWRYADQDFIEPKNSYKRIIIRGDGKEYESTLAASIDMKCHKRAIHYAIKNNTKSKGFKWVYKEDRVFNQDEINGEIWKQHPTLPIKVSDHGRIDNYRITYGSIGKAYKTVTILYKGYSVHRLVAETFHPNPDNLPCVDHFDGNKCNNRASNLRWCTSRQNTIWYHENKK